MIFLVNACHHKTNPRGFFEVCRQSWINISSLNSTTVHPRTVMSRAICMAGSFVFLSAIYIRINLKTSGASFFTDLFDVRIIGFWMTSFDRKHNHDIHWIIVSTFLSTANVFFVLKYYYYYLGLPVNISNLLLKRHVGF